MQPASQLQNPSFYKDPTNHRTESRSLPLTGQMPISSRNPAFPLSGILRGHTGSCQSSQTSKLGVDSCVFVARGGTRVGNRQHGAVKAVLGDFCEDWHLLLPITVGQR